MESTAAYYDFQGLSTLRAKAVQAPTEAIGEVAAQFESLFVQMMLKSMRDATIEGGLFDSNQMEVYQSMFDQQVSLDLSSQGVLGLADILVEQLEGPRSPDAQGVDADAMAPLADLLSDARRYMGAVSSPSTPLVAGVAAASDANPTAVASDIVQADKVQADWQPSSPEEFIRGVWDYAVDAAKQLGVDPAVLVAQSALETGWGKRVIQSLDGASSFNLFGVKSGSGWSGKSTAVNTLEFRGGIAEMESASFRVYDTLESSFNDYVDFLKSNPRYQQALGMVADSREFVNGLQEAGYATDPGYAEKIMDIIGTTSYESVVSKLKNFQ
ncbi:MAG: flagellar protein FlgJ [Halioglobus sp.]|jgi:flagellar protein FlgJ